MNSRPKYPIATAFLGLVAALLLLVLFRSACMPFIRINDGVPRHLRPLHEVRRRGEALLIRNFHGDVFDDTCSWGSAQEKFFARNADTVCFRDHPPTDAADERWMRTTGALFVSMNHGYWAALTSDFEAAQWTEEKRWEVVQRIKFVGGWPTWEQVRPPRPIAYPPPPELSR